jgi:putative DNA primase/helicase
MLPKDPYLEEKLAQPEVKAAIISWALSMPTAMRDLILQKPGEVSDRVKYAQRDTALAGDPIKSFVDHCLRPSLNPAAPKLRSEHLHSLYCAYAEAFGYQKAGEKKFRG